MCWESMKSYVFLFMFHCWVAGCDWPPRSQSVFYYCTYVPVTLLNFFNYLTITSLSNFRS